MGGYFYCSKCGNFVPVDRTLAIHRWDLQIRESRKCCPVMLIILQMALVA